jgi:hypothetical protein
MKKNEPIPIIKSSVRLIRQLFSGATDIPEFQRQVATPNVPKFTNALASLAEKNLDMELTVRASLFGHDTRLNRPQILVFTTLTRLIPLYPTLHRVQHSALSALSLKFLSGTAPQPTSISLMETASCLYSVLPLTGGKVGSISLWRKSMDDTLAFAWSAFLGLRSTFPNEGIALHARGIYSTH